MRVLVTGGAGYIGSHTCVELLKIGNDVIVADNLSNSSQESLNRVKTITGRSLEFHNFDLSDEAKLTKLFEDQPIEAVIHFAGLKSVDESVNNPLAYYENNLGCTLTLCKVMEKFGVHKLVFSSSATVYGDPSKVPVEEKMPIQPTNPYGQTKAMIEQILKDLAVAKAEWEICILRYFNPVGAHESGLIGEDPNGIPNNLLPYVAQVAVGKLEKVSVFGNDYDTVDGTGVRDYIHVVDLAKGHILALDSLTSANKVSIYNLGTGSGISVLQAISAFERASGKKIAYQVAPRRPGDIASCYADVTKAETELHWKAHKTFDTACEDSWRWQSKNPDGYK
jgi:UDP-glucose 4-epimerase